MDSREFFYNFGKLIYKIDGFYERFSVPKKVKQNLMWILYAINDGKPHSQKEICENWDLPRTTVNTIIKEIEKDGLIELQPIEGEKRELHIILTQKGKEYSARVLDELYTKEKELFERIKPSANEIISCLENLQKEYKNVFDKEEL